MLVLEKNTGRVLRVTNGVVQDPPVLDLAVNNFSERGLLGIALHPFFPFNRGVYLYWSCRTDAAPTDPFVPAAERCVDSPMLGEDSAEPLDVPLLGNRVDRFEWTGSQLVFDRNLIMLRSFQNDAAPQPPGQGDELQPARGNHNGGVIRFGFDRKTLGHRRRPGAPWPASEPRVRPDTADRRRPVRRARAGRCAPDGRDPQAERQRVGAP